MTRKPPVVVYKRLPTLGRDLLTRVEVRLAQSDAPKLIAAEEGVSLSTVYGLNHRRKLAAAAAAAEPVPRVVHDPAASKRQHLAHLLAHPKPEPLGVARVVWGRRLALGDDCLRLDGRPLTFFALMGKTNAALAADGLPVLGAFAE